MTIIDFPTGERARASHARSSHPASRTIARPSTRARSVVGEPPTGAWLAAYEELAACCAEVVATSPVRVYDAEWDDLVDWIRSRLGVLDALKSPGAS